MSALLQTSSARWGRIVPAAILLAFFLAGCRKPKPYINVYVDPEPFMSYRVMWHFTQENKIEIKQFHNPQFSPQASVDRMMLEAQHPLVDVYWSGDPIYCEMLRQRNMTLPSRHQFNIPDAFQEKDGHWTGIAARPRILLVHKNLTLDDPQSIRAYADPAWKGRGALADPLVGNTRSEFTALSLIWGDEELASFYDALLKNGTYITKTVEESVDRVVKGESDFALVDLDYALKVLEKDAPVEIVYPDQAKGEPGVMMIPNAVTIMRSCRDTETAQALVDFLASIDNEVRLTRWEPSYIPLEPQVALTSPYARRPESVHLMHVDYAAAAKKIVDMEKILGNGADRKDLRGSR